MFSLINIQPKKAITVFVSSLFNVSKYKFFVVFITFIAFWGLAGNLQAAESGLSIHLNPTIIGHIGSFPITNTLITVWFVIAFLIGLALFVRSNIKLIPSKLQLIFEEMGFPLLSSFRSFHRQVFLASPPRTYVDLKHCANSVTLLEVRSLRITWSREKFSLSLFQDER